MSKVNEFLSHVNTLITLVLILAAMIAIKLCSTMLNLVTLAIAPKDHGDPAGVVVSGKSAKKPQKGSFKKASKSSSIKSLSTKSSKSADSRKDTSKLVGSASKSAKAKLERGSMKQNGRDKEPLDNMHRQLWNQKKDTFNYLNDPQRAKCYQIIYSE